MLVELTRHTPPSLAALESIQGWTRRRFKLAPEAPVLVSEVACSRTGCPPLETVVAFWLGDQDRRQFRLYKPMAEVVYDDIGWLMDLPGSSERPGWDCC